jgi:transposase
MLIDELRQDLITLDECVEVMDKKIKLLVSSHSEANRLLAIPEIGSITATAIISAIGNGK